MVETHFVCTIKTPQQPSNQVADRPKVFSYAEVRNLHAPPVFIFWLDRRGAGPVNAKVCCSVAGSFAE